MITIYIYNIISSILYILNLIILIRVVLSWLAPNSDNGFTELVYAITEPILRPIRNMIPMHNSRIDVSPIIAYLFFIIIQRVLAIILF